MLQERGGDSNIQGLVLIINIVVVAIVIAIVVLTMVEFCGGTVVAPVVPGIILAASIGVATTSVLLQFGYTSILEWPEI